MKIATFTRDMAPFRAGDSRVVPDVVGDRLESEGSAKLSPFPPADMAPPALETLHRPGRRYPHRLK
jgi:hypothetical protein